MWPETCFLCMKEDNVTFVGETISSQIEYLFPEITTLKLGIPLHVCVSCGKKLELFNEFKHACLEYSQHFERRMKATQNSVARTNGVCVPKYSAIPASSTGNACVNREIRELYVRNTEVDNGNNSGIRTYDEPDSVSAKDSVVPEKYDSNTFPFQIFVKEEPLKESYSNTFYKTYLQDIAQTDNVVNSADYCSGFKKKTNKENEVDNNQTLYVNVETDIDMKSTATENYFIKNKTVEKDLNYTFCDELKIEAFENDHAYCRQSFKKTKVNHIIEEEKGKNIERMETKEENIEDIIDDNLTCIVIIDDDDIVEDETSNHGECVSNLDDLEKCTQANTALDEDTVGNNGNTTLNETAVGSDGNVDSASVIKKKELSSENDSDTDLDLDVYQCFACKKILTTNRSLACHLARCKYIAKKKNSKYQCFGCTKGFRIYKNFSKHLDNCPYNEKKEKCDICKVVFENRRIMLYHKREHYVTEKYQCNLCEKSFASKHNLRKHKKAHLGIKDFPCTLCDKLFSTSRTLQNHITRHYGIKRYKCSVCDKPFYTNTDVKHHMKIYHGIHNYVCYLCGDTFPTEQYLRKHMSLHNSA